MIFSPMIFVQITDTDNLCACGSPREKSLVVARFDLDYLVSILSLSRFITFKYNLGIEAKATNTQNPARQFMWKHEKQ